MAKLSVFHLLEEAADTGPSAWKAPEVYLCMHYSGTLVWECTVIDWTMESCCVVVCFWYAIFICLACKPSYITTIFLILKTVFLCM